ncbi:AtpZ/AtpI family protein [Terrarubrum flagellatum]|uniref:AtpZ/AtpI family protein n=1 Tax=Terrirubrum flagellatum TaxID=2895980 RepID=UPI00314503EE
MTDDKSARGEDEALKARLEKLSAALDATKQAPTRRFAEAASNDASGQGSAMNLGFRVLTEFVAGVIAGCLIGYLLDLWLGTSPVALIVFIFLGTATGFWNVYRIAMKPTGR